MKEDRRAALSKHKEKVPPGGSSLALPLSRPQALYLALVLLVQLYCHFLHAYGPLRRLEFLPLVLTSVTCAVAILWTWTHTLILFYKR